MIFPRRLHGRFMYQFKWMLIVALSENIGYNLTPSASIDAIPYPLPLRH